MIKFFQKDLQGLEWEDKAMIKMVVSDMDGTLLNKRSEIWKRFTDWRITISSLSSRQAEIIMGYIMFLTDMGLHVKRFWAMAQSMWTDRAIFL